MVYATGFDNMGNMIRNFPNHEGFPAESLGPQVQLVYAEEWLTEDRVAPYADVALHAIGGEGIIVPLIPGYERRKWHNAEVVLDAGLLPAEHSHQDMYLTLVAHRLTGKRTVGDIGAYAVIGRRVVGSRKIIHAMNGFPEEVTWELNKFTAWREDIR